MASVLAGRRSRWAFALGTAAVTLGVILHLPMFMMGASMGYRLAGMPMDKGMLAGMGFIVGGLALAAWACCLGDWRVRPRLWPFAWTRTRR